MDGKVGGKGKVGCGGRYRGQQMRKLCSNHLEIVIQFRVPRGPFGRELMCLFSDCPPHLTALMSTVCR